MMLRSDANYRQDIPFDGDFQWSQAEAFVPLIAADLIDIQNDVRESSWDRRGMNGMGVAWMPYAPGMGQVSTPPLRVEPTIQQLSAWVDSRPEVKRFLNNHPALRRALRRGIQDTGISGLGQSTFGSSACDPTCPAINTMNSVGEPCCGPSPGTTTSIPVGTSSVYNYTDGAGTLWGCTGTGCTPIYGGSAPLSSSLIPGVPNSMLFMGVGLVAAIALMGGRR